MGKPPGTYYCGTCKLWTGVKHPEGGYACLYCRKRWWDNTVGG